MAAGLLLLVLIVGLVSGCWVEKHWENKETIRDSGSVHHVTDSEDPDSYTEGNDRDTGILPAEGWEDRVTISDADGSPSPEEPIRSRSPIRHPRMGMRRWWFCRRRWTRIP